MPETRAERRRSPRRRRASGDETEGAGQEAVVTMELAAEGDRAKIQNEPSAWFKCG